MNLSTTSESIAAATAAAAATSPNPHHHYNNNTTSATATQFNSIDTTFDIDSFFAFATTTTNNASLFNSCPPNRHSDLQSLIDSNTDSATINATILHWHISVTTQADTINQHD